MEEIDKSGSSGSWDGTRCTGISDGANISGYSGTSGRIISKEEFNRLKEDKWYRFKYNFTELIESIKITIEYWFWDWNSVKLAYYKIGGNFINTIFNRNSLLCMKKTNDLDYVYGCPSCGCTESTPDNNHDYAYYCINCGEWYESPDV